MIEAQSLIAHCKSPMQFVMGTGFIERRLRNGVKL